MEPFRGRGARVASRQDANVLHEFARFAVHAAEGVAGGGVTAQGRINARDEQKGDHERNEGVSLR